MNYPSLFIKLALKQKKKKRVKRPRFDQGWPET
jgi:hypothetical protein